MSRKKAKPRAARSEPAKPAMSLAQFLEQTKKEMPILIEKHLPALKRSVELLDEHIEGTPDEQLAIRLNQAFQIVLADTPPKSPNHYFTRIGALISAINDIEEASTRESFKQGIGDD